MNIHDRSEALRKEIDETIQRERWRFHLLYAVGISVIVLSVIASGLATLLGLGTVSRSESHRSDRRDPWGFLTFAGATLRLSEQASWHLTRKEMVVALFAAGYCYELPLEPSADNIAAIAEDWTHLDRRLHEELTQKVLPKSAPIKAREDHN